MRAYLSHPIALTAAFALLAACSPPEREATPDAVEEATPPPVEDPTPTDQPAEVSTIDELAKLSATAHGLAFWKHPTLPFKSMVIAATGVGVIGYDIEDGAEVARLEGIEAGGVDIAYIGQGDTSRAVMAVHDRSQQAIVFYGVDNISRQFAPDLTAIAIDEDADGFCFGRIPGREMFTLYVLRDDRLYGQDIGAYASSNVLQDVVIHSLPAAAVACAVDDRDGSVFVAAKDGAIYRFDRGEGLTTPFAQSAARQPVSIGIALNGSIDSDTSDPCCGQIALLNGADGVVHLFDRKDGRDLGAVRLIRFDEIEGVHAATAMALGYANYGGIYRSGALALATNGESPALRMTPFGGIANALEFTLGEPVNPRGSNPEPDKDPNTIIDIEIVKP